MAIHFEGNPSEITDEYWVYARRKIGIYPSHTTRVGKWMIFVPVQDIDDVWAKIRLAVEEGKLGNEAKSATSRPNPNSNDPNTKVICIYTYDGDDEADVWKVREALRELGITQKIYWKADQATRDGLYNARGHARVSRYGG